MFNINTTHVIINCNHYTVPTSQPVVTVTQSDDNQPREDDKSSQVQLTNGWFVYICGVLLYVSMRHQKMVAMYNLCTPDS